MTSTTKQVLCKYARISKDFEVCILKTTNGFIWRKFKDSDDGLWEFSNTSFPFIYSAASSLQTPEGIGSEDIPSVDYSDYKWLCKYEKSEIKRLSNLNKDFKDKFGFFADLKKREFVVVRSKNYHYAFPNCNNISKILFLNSANKEFVVQKKLNKHPSGEWEEIKIHDEEWSLFNSRVQHHIGESLFNEEIDSIFSYINGINLLFNAKLTLNRIADAKLKIILNKIIGFAEATIGFETEHFKIAEEESEKYLKAEGERLNFVQLALSRGNSPTNVAKYQDHLKDIENYIRFGNDLMIEEAADLEKIKLIRYRSNSEAKSNNHLQSIAHLFRTLQRRLDGKATSDTNFNTKDLIDQLPAASKWILKFPIHAIDTLNLALDGFFNLAEFKAFECGISLDCIAILSFIAFIEAIRSRDPTETFKWAKLITQFDKADLRRGFLSTASRDWVERKSWAKRWADEEIKKIHGWSDQAFAIISLFEVLSGYCLCRKIKNNNLKPTFTQLRNIIQFFKKHTKRLTAIKAFYRRDKLLKPCRQIFKGNIQINRTKLDYFDLLSMCNNFNKFYTEVYPNIISTINDNLKGINSIKIKNMYKNSNPFEFKYLLTKKTFRFIRKIRKQLTDAQLMRRKLGRKLLRLERKKANNQTIKVYSKNAAGKILTEQSHIDPFNFPFTLNPVIGCLFGCKYCYLQEGWFSRQTKFGEEMLLKENLIPKLQSELFKYREFPQHLRRVQIGSASEGYHPDAIKLCKEIPKSGLMSSIIQLFLDEQKRGFPWAVHLVTKSPLIENDIHLLKRLACFQAEITITTLFEAVKKQWEGSAPSVARRFEIIRRLCDQGIFVRVMVMPLFLTPEREHEIRVRMSGMSQEKIKAEIKALCNQDALAIWEKAKSYGARALKTKDLNYFNADQLISGDGKAKRVKGRDEDPGKSLLIHSGEYLKNQDGSYITGQFETFWKGAGKKEKADGTVRSIKKMFQMGKKIRRIMDFGYRLIDSAKDFDWGDCTC